MSGPDEILLGLLCTTGLIVWTIDAWPLSVIWLLFIAATVRVAAWARTEDASW